jgi:hypothetical protein
MVDQHLSDRDIDLLAGGQLDPTTVEDLIQHVIGCDACQARLETAWDIDLGSPEDIASAGDLEQRIMRRVARYETIRQSAIFLAAGYLQAVLAVLGAVFGRSWFKE